MQERLRGLSEDENNQRWLFVAEDDIKDLPCFQNQTLVAIKAPYGTTLEVPDPDEAVDHSQRRYRIVLRSTIGCLNVYLVRVLLISGSSDADVSITDMWRAEPEIDWNSLSTLHEDYNTMTSTSMFQAQTPPPSTSTPTVVDATMNKTQSNT